MKVKKMHFGGKLIPAAIVFLVLAMSAAVSLAGDDSERPSRQGTVPNYSLDYAQISIGAGQMISSNYAAEAILSVSSTEQIAQSATNYDVSNVIGGQGLPVPVTLSSFEID